MDIEKAKSAAVVVAKLKPNQDERDHFQQLLDSGAALDSLVVRGLSQAEAAIILTAIIAVYDARAVAVGVDLGKL